MKFNEIFVTTKDTIDSILSEIVWDERFFRYLFSTQRTNSLVEDFIGTFKDILTGSDYAEYEGKWEEKKNLRNLWNYFGKYEDFVHFILRQIENDLDLGKSFFYIVRIYDELYARNLVLPKPLYKKLVAPYWKELLQKLNDNSADWYKYLISDDNED